MAHSQGAPLVRWPGACTFGFFAGESPIRRTKELND